MNLSINNEYRRHMTHLEGASLFGQSLYSLKAKDMYQDKGTKVQFSSADISENDMKFR